jgi:formyltetrahydrofolate deformylase
VSVICQGIIISVKSNVDQKNLHVLNIACPDSPGIVAAVTACLFECGANIVEAEQFNDEKAARFFMRVEVDLKQSFVEVFKENFLGVASRYGMDWRFMPRSRRKRVFLLGNL